MLDIILGVRDSWEWHTENVQRNKGDYAWPMSWCPGQSHSVGAICFSSLTSIAGSVAGHVQERGGAHMLYHPYIDVSELTGTRQQLKYGVISIRFCHI